jgi:hypothetical protein
MALQILLELRNWHERVFSSLVADGAPYVLLNRGAISALPLFYPKSGTIVRRRAYIRKESLMATEPKRREPDIPAQKPDIQPEPRPEEIPQDKDVPEKEAPMQL